MLTRTLNLKISVRLAKNKPGLASGDATRRYTCSSTTLPRKISQLLLPAANALTTVPIIVMSSLIAPLTASTVPNSEKFGYGQGFHGESRRPMAQTILAYGCAAPGSSGHQPRGEVPLMRV